jgi:hypothetical protein
MTYFGLWQISVKKGAGETVTYPEGITLELGAETGKMVILDDKSVPHEDVTDDEFIELVRRFRSREVSIH